VRKGRVSAAGFDLLIDTAKIAAMAVIGIQALILLIPSGLLLDYSTTLVCGALQRIKKPGLSS
jgi:hypothetical protein